jgi:hypothetical protein
MPQVFEGGIPTGLITPDSAASISESEALKPEAVTLSLEVLSGKVAALEERFNRLVDENYRNHAY